MRLILVLCIIIFSRALSRFSWASVYVRWSMFKCE